MTRAAATDDVVIIGAGIAGLTLALALTLHQAGIRCRVLEAVPAMRAVGVGINLLPPAVGVLSRLGLEPDLARVAVETAEATFFNRFGQLIYAEPLGRHAGLPHPQYSIHRGDLHAILLAAVQARLGPDAVRTGVRTTHVTQDAAGVCVHLTGPSGDALPPVTGGLAIACDGIHSAVRKQLYPQEGPPRYSGINMWRGVTRWPPFLIGANMVRAGWFAGGKLVIYPIRNRIDDAGRQLVNWVAEIETPRYEARDWTRKGRPGDFMPAYADWHFDWLDVPAFLAAADEVLEFPMVDQDPLPAWSFGRVTLLGDAAHPMVPRGSNGAGQAILDAEALAQCLASGSDPVGALKAYEQRRLAATARIVLANRTTPPDVILQEVWKRTGDRPFNRIDDVISRDELAAMTGSYRALTNADPVATGGRG